ncbi:hypothetical protein [Haloarcula laminariae]|uniref:hypothetical protein n=1 Tax=Haloarcula laminariae TaxID=2961577 RepID=UPI002405F46E|nr:hypothetical protein [Halomicroarcula sp. FL173]
MDRRTLLGTVSSIGVAALTGCLSDGTGDSTPSATGTGATTATPSPTPTPNTTLSDFTFSVSGIESGIQTDSATVSADDGNVVVEGTIWGADGCRTAELPSVNYDGTTDGLTVPVETTERADAGDGCTQATVEIAYTATISFKNGLPDTVVVTHDRGDGPATVTTTSL